MKFFSTHSIFDWTIFGGIQYVVLTIVAMYLYPGSTYHDYTTTHYFFSENFLSDLGRTQTFNGAPNPYSSWIYLFTLSFVGMTTAILFLILPKVLAKDTLTRFIAYLMVGVGIISGFGFIGIALAPSDTQHTVHMLCVNIGFKGLLFALFLLMIAIYRSKHYSRFYGHVLLGIILLLGFYVLLITIGPNPSDSKNGLIIQVVGQKIIVYSLILGLSFQAYGAKKIFMKNHITET